VDSPSRRYFRDERDSERIVAACHACTNLSIDPRDESGRRRGISLTRDPREGGEPSEAGARDLDPTFRKVCAENGRAGWSGATAGVVRAAPNNERGGIPRLDRRLGFWPETAKVPNARGSTTRRERGSGEGEEEPVYRRFNPAGSERSATSTACSGLLCFLGNVIVPPDTNRVRDNDRAAMSKCEMQPVTQ